METIELMVMHAEHHKLTVLWTACRIGPNTAEAAVKADYRKISARRRCYTEADSQYRPSAKINRVIVASFKCLGQI